MGKFCKELSLAFLNPELCLEWDYEKNYPLKPEDVFAHSGRKVHWKCKMCNNVWIATIDSRSKIDGNGCPYCSGRMATLDNCLGAKNPKLAKEWHPTKNGKLTPYDVLPNSSKVVWWKCKNGHEWRQKISGRNSPGCGCPCCSGHKVCIDNCLATVNPQLAKEWHPTKNGKLTPYDVTCGSSKKVLWKCKKGHVWEAIINNRNGGSGCPYCSGQKVCKDNCLATRNPKLAKEWDYDKNGKLTPQDVTCGSVKIVHWLCKKGHSYSMAIYDRIRGNNCPYCSGRRLCKENCLATINPELAKEWDYEKNGNLTPQDVTSCSSKNVCWICEYKHEWKATIYSRNYGQGCPYCDGKKVCEDNCLATLNPELAREWHPTKNGNLTPNDVTPYSSKMAYWICEEKHEWLARIYSRSGGSGCPYCDNKIILNNGVVCDSFPEAYYCKTELMDKNIRFQNHVKIGLGKCTCDFYIPFTNTYIDVTSFNKKFHGWKEYHKGISRKKKHVTKILKANYEFIQIKLTRQQIQYIKENMI